MRMRMQFRPGCPLPWKKMSETSVKIIKNEVSCRDDTVPKTVDTRKHCKVYRVESMQQSSATPSLHLCFSGLQKIVACSQPYLAVLSCIYSFWHCVIPTSYFIFTDFYTCNYTCTDVLINYIQATLTYTECSMWQDGNNSNKNTSSEGIGYMTLYMSNNTTRLSDWDTKMTPKES